jgi:hypothetical protein
MIALPVLALTMTTKLQKNGFAEAFDALPIQTQR